MWLRFAKIFRSLGAIVLSTIAQIAPSTHDQPLTTNHSLGGLEAAPGAWLVLAMSKVAQLNHPGP